MQTDVVEKIAQEVKILSSEQREKALRVKSEIFDAKFITTEIVLIEVLNFFSEYGGKSSS